MVKCQPKEIYNHKNSIVDRRRNIIYSIIDLGQRQLIINLESVIHMKSNCILLVKIKSKLIVKTLTDNFLLCKVNQFLKILLIY